MQLSTITVKDIIPEATRAIERYTKRSDPSVTLFKYDTHMTIEDLVMDTAEKVIKANPKYLTKTYVWLAAKSVCINRMNRKKLITFPVVPPFEFEDGVATPIEEELPGDTRDYLEELQEFLAEGLPKDDQILLSLLLKGKMYAEIAEKLGISLRTLERRIQDLKWKTEYLLTEVDPDVEPLIF